MKTYLKTLVRIFRKHITRFISIILIVLVSVGFIAGFGSASDRINISLCDYYASQNVSDFIAKSTSDSGFSDEDVEAIKEIYGEGNVNTGASVDVYLNKTEDNPDGELTRLYFLDSLNSGFTGYGDTGEITVNIPDVVEVYGTGSSSGTGTDSSMGTASASTASVHTASAATDTDGTGSATGTASANTASVHTASADTDTDGTDNATDGTDNATDGTDTDSATGTGVVNPVACEVSDNRILGYEPLQTVHIDFIDVMDQLAMQASGDGETGLEESYITYLEMLLTYTEMDVTVTEVVSSPLTFAMDGEPSYLNGEDTETPDSVNAANDLIDLENILYIPSSYIPEISFSSIPSIFQSMIPDSVSEGPLLGTMDMYIALQDRDTFNTFSSAYEKLTDTEQANLVSVLGTDMQVITLYENYSFVALKSYSDDMLYIGILLMVIFLLVTVLVVLSTMSRLVEEERSQIACLRTLGYSSSGIIMKYVLFAVIAMIVGAIIGYFVGLGLTTLMYYVFNYTFLMPPMTPKTGMTFFIITVAVILVATLVGTVWAGVKETKEKPANLLRPKPPKAGKKVFLEKIPFIWNRLSFKYKSTARNVLRYLPRFIMTVVSVAIATALVLVGLALLDLCLFGSIGSASVTAVAVVVVAFAAFLAVIVVYTLTNINISEREKELATLKVLGYRDGEVCGYIYREVYIDTVVGIIFGLPLSLPIDLILFSILGMGSILGVSWFMWIIGVVVVIFFTWLVTMMLRRKIVRIDMNESLKAVE